MGTMQPTGGNVPSVEAYFEYSVDLEVADRRMTVFANLLFRNNTQQMLEHPEILIRVSPEKAAEVSGKILSPELTKVMGVYTRDGKQKGWMFKTNDWLRHGKSTGEYWIQSIEPLRLAPGQWAEVNEMQIEFSLENGVKSVRIDAYIKENQQMHRALNPVLIHISGI